ncbi:MAG: helix-turn-helix transcriptional regulator [Clostridia bacterium]|nr:helix-turn-helix transcriptional regulator [Clostridia bacterium]
MEEIQLQLFGDEDFPERKDADTDMEGDAFQEGAGALSTLTGLRRTALPMLSVRSFASVPLSPVPEIVPMLLTEHTLLFILEGEMHCDIGGNGFTACKGDCLYAAPGMLFSRAESCVPCAYLHLCFWDDTPRPDGESGDTVYAYPHKMTYLEDKDLCATVDYLRRVSETGSPDQTKKLLAALQLLLIQMEDAAARASGSDYVREMKQYLFDHYREGVQLCDLAAHVNLHPVYCAKVFRQNEGMTVGEFINHLRITRAVAQLENVAETSEVARDLGLSEYYFSRWFRRMTGVTPTEYRNSLRSAYIKH